MFINRFRSFLKENTVQNHLIGAICNLLVCPIIIYWLYLLIQQIWCEINEPIIFRFCLFDFAGIAECRSFLYAKRWCQNNIRTTMEFIFRNSGLSISSNSWWWIHACRSSNITWRNWFDWHRYFGWK